MMGQPYSAHLVAKELRGPVVEPMFGPFHLGLYQHASQVVRRGYAAPFDAPDVLDRPRRFAAASGVRGGHLKAESDGGGAIGDLRPDHFRDKHVTLVTAAENHLWHRDSMDLMYEWLCRIPTGPGPRPYRKLVFAGYNIQELLWGIHAKDDVFPSIAAGLAPIAVSPSSRPGPNQAPPSLHPDASVGVE
jgi:hypothetical protein